MKRAMMLVAMVLALGASCSRSNAPCATSIQGDSSLTPAEYVDRGFPAVDRPWVTADYQSALRAMQALPMAQYPRTNSPKSRAVVDRLSNPENLGLYRQKSLPLALRMMPCEELMDAVTGFNKLYLSAHLTAPLFAEDLTRMHGFMLRLLVVMIELVEEFLPTLDKNDASYAMRIAGFEQMKSGMALVVQGVLIMMEDRKTCTGPSREELASTIATTWPTIVSHLPPLSRKEFEARLRRIMNQETDASVRGSIAKAIEGK